MHDQCCNQFREQCHRESIRSRFSMSGVGNIRRSLEFSPTAAKVPGCSGRPGRIGAMKLRRRMLLLAGKINRMDYPTCQQFAAHVGSSFSVQTTEGVPMRFELTAVTPYPAGPEPTDVSIRIASFSIFLRGPSQPLYPQNSYDMEHAVLGSLPIFIVPIGPDKLGMRYEAVFNQA